MNLASVRHFGRFHIDLLSIQFHSTTSIKLRLVSLQTSASETHMIVIGVQETFILQESEQSRR